MHTHRKILFLLVLAATAVFSCKKKTSEPSSAPTPTFIKDAVDTIVGLYSGELHYYEHIGNRIFDTTTYNDTFFVIKKTDTSFYFYRTSIYTGRPDTLYDTYNDTNIYEQRLGGAKYYLLKFFLHNDSIYYEFWMDYNSIHTGFYETNETFSGKKIK